MTNHPQENFNFEASLKKLENILHDLESEECSDLNKQVVLFKEGMLLAKQCRDKLSTAKQCFETAVCNPELSTQVHSPPTEGLSDADNKLDHDTPPDE